MHLTVPPFYILIIQRSFLKKKNIIREKRAGVINILKYTLYRIIILLWRNSITNRYHQCTIRRQIQTSLQMIHVEIFDYYSRYHCCYQRLTATTCLLSPLLFIVLSLLLPILISN